MVNRAHFLSAFPYDKRKHGTLVWKTLSVTKPVRVLSSQKGCFVDAHSIPRAKHCLRSV